MVGSGSLWSQAARPPGKPQTGPRPPAHTTLLPQPTPLMNWDLVHKTTARCDQTVWLQQDRVSGGCAAGAGTQSPLSGRPHRPGPAGLGSSAAPVLCAHGSGPSHSHPLGGPLSGPPSQQQDSVHVALLARPRLAGGVGACGVLPAVPASLGSALPQDLGPQTLPPTSPGPMPRLPPHLLQTHPLAVAPLSLSRAPDSYTTRKGPASSLPGPSSPPTPRGQGPGLSPIWAADSQQGRPRTGDGTNG